MDENVLQRAGRVFSAMPFGTRVGAAAAVALLAAGTAWLVYATGGARFAYLHLMYVPIVLGALAFGVPGGVAAGVVGGLLPENTRRHGLDPAEIDLEITESAVMSDPDYCIRLIAQLRERGYRISIDDFGVGQSSLSYLQKLRVSDLKIDQGFVKALPTDVNNQKIVRSILHLATSMGLATIAEGVEDDETLALLREWGCDYAQGYGIHRPAPSADLLRFVQEWPTRPQSRGM